MYAVLEFWLGALLVVRIFPLITSPEGGSTPTADKFLSLGMTCTWKAGDAIHPSARIFLARCRDWERLTLVMELNPIARRPFYLMVSIISHFLPLTVSSQNPPQPLAREI